MPAARQRHAAGKHFAGHAMHAAAGRTSAAKRPIRSDGSPCRGEQQLLAATAHLGTDKPNQPLTGLGPRFQRQGHGLGSGQPHAGLVVPRQPGLVTASLQLHKARQDKTRTGGVAWDQPTPRVTNTRLPVLLCPVLDQGPEAHGCASAAAQLAAATLQQHTRGLVRA